MSKDAYRPSTSDVEVTETGGHPEIPQRPGQGSSPVTPPRHGDDQFVGDDSPARRDDFRENLVVTGLRIAKQEIYYSVDGRMRVNVTFEWEELADADSYYVRVTPA